MNPIIAKTSDGEFRRIALDSQIVIQAGDSINVVGSQIIVTRAGVVVGTRNLVGPDVAIPVTADHQQVISSAVFFRRYPVAGKLSTMIAVEKNTSSGSITFSYSDGTQLEFASGASVIEATDYIDTEPTLGQHILARKAMLNSPNETNLETMVGATCAIDCNATQPVSIRID